MNADNQKQTHKINGTDDDFEDEELHEYDDFDILERLESIREDMEELGVTTLAEVIQRIEEMHQRLDRQ